MPPRPTDQPHEPTVDAVLAEYMQRLDRGEQVDQQSLLRKYPEFDEELRDYFLSEQAVGYPSAQPTKTIGQQPTPRNVFKIRCPDCRMPAAIKADLPLSDVVCKSCGCNFSLASDGGNSKDAPTITSFGHFELIERLGIGGFGSVWKARDSELDRVVAIKIPHGGQMDQGETERFIREARASAQLQHPNIASVYEVGREGDTVYIVSELIRGITLEDWLTGQAPTFREAAELCSMIAKALHHAHERGVIHRDLKPANVMIDGDMQPHLLDFGLARREVGEITMTIDGQLLGTPAFMSPEQAKCEAHTADQRTDIYSLGVILFKLVTGELPFRGNPQMLIYQVIHDEPPNPCKLNATVPQDLATIAIKCLEKDPEQRYGTAQQFAEEVDRFLEGKPILARPISKIGRSWRWCKRNRLVSALSFCLLLTLAVLVGALVYTLVDVTDQLQLAKNLQLIDEFAVIQSGTNGAPASTQNLMLAVDRYREFVAANPASLEPKRYMVKGLLRLSDSQRNDSLMEEAAKGAYEALEIIEEVRARSNDARDLHTLADAWNRIGLLQTGDDSISAMERAHENYSELVVLTDDPAHKLATGNACFNLGLKTRERNREESIAWLRKAIELLRQATDEMNPNVDAKTMLAYSSEFLADIFVHGPHTEKSLSLLVNAVQLRSELAEQDRQNVDRLGALAESHNRLALAYQKLDRVDDALQSFQLNIETRKQALHRNLESDKVIIDSANMLCASYNNISLVAMPGELARTLLEQLKELTESTIPINRLGPVAQYQYACAFFNIGESLNAAGETEQALSSFDHAVGLLQRLVDSGQGPHYGDDLKTAKAQQQALKKMLDND